MPITADDAAAMVEMAEARSGLNAMALPPITFTIAINQRQGTRGTRGRSAPSPVRCGTVTIPVDANIAPLVAKMAVAEGVASAQGGGSWHPRHSALG